MHLPHRCNIRTHNRMYDVQRADGMWRADGMPAAGADGVQAAGAHWVQAAGTSCMRPASTMLLFAADPDRWAAGLSLDAQAEWLCDCYRLRMDDDYVRAAHHTKLHSASKLLQHCCHKAPRSHHAPSQLVVNGLASHATPHTCPAV